MKENMKLIESLNNYNQEIKKPLKEDEQDSVKLFMNTWANYNENGADTDSIGGGWMTPEQALEFAEKHNEEEPFINDVDDNIGLPFEIDEYSNVESTIEQIQNYLSLDDDERTIIKGIVEFGEDYKEAKEIYDNGDYSFYPEVDNEYELGSYYVDEVGFEGINNAANYFDLDSYRRDVELEWDDTNEREQVKEDYPDLEEGSDEFEEKVEEYVSNSIDSWIDEIDYAISQDKLNDYLSKDIIERYFDYKSLGRDLSYDGMFVEGGFIEIH